MRWDNYKAAKMDVFWDHWSVRSTHAAVVFTEKQMKSMLHNELKQSHVLKLEMLVYRGLPLAEQTYAALCTIIKNQIKERKLDKQTALEQSQMNCQKILGPKVDGSAAAAEAGKAKGKGKEKKKDGSSEGKNRGRDRSREPKALAAATGEDEWTEVTRSKSAIRRSAKKEKAAAALAAEGGGTATKGSGKPKATCKGDGTPKDKTRLCFYFNSPSGCNKTNEECTYLHKKGSKKELEELAQAKAKGKAARAGSPAPPGGKGKNSGKTAKTVVAAVAAAQVTDICPLGDACLDSVCWRTLTHVNSAYVARDGPLFPDEYSHVEPDLDASEQ